MNTLVLGHERNAVKSHAMPKRPTPKTQKLIARFMSASSPVEAYLQKHGPLTHIEVESLTLTVSGLQTFLEIWKRKENERLGQPDNPFIKLPSSLK